MEQALSKPVELAESDLDLVAGGNPFSYSNNYGNFVIGAVSGDYSDFRYSTNIGQLNTYGDNKA
jgi:hypothetical protein